MNNRLGCLTGSGIIAALLTILIVAGITLAQGGVLFNPGPLNAQTGEALSGIHSHADLANQCKACHTAFWEVDSMAERCIACHTSIPIELVDSHSLHGVVFQEYAELICRKCHPEHNGPDGILTDMNADDFPHEALGYALTGHQKFQNGALFQCNDCHTNKQYSPFDPSICETCHRQIDSDFTVAHILTFGNDCLACHDGIDTYGDDFNHDLFTFPLTGKHITVDCSQCHVSARSIPDLQSAPVDCVSCHAKDDIHLGDLGSSCASCHTPEDWTITSFDHSLAAFKLDGKHAGVTCESCHTDKLFKNTPTDCYSCHAIDDIHQGNLGFDCQDCHTSAGWTPANFDHNLAAFKLVGKHAGVTCESCHIDKLFKNTPTDCYACHASDDIHQGNLGLSCQNCHTSAGWTPANFDHNLAAFMLTGKHAGVACDACHTDKLFKNTPTDCYSCHAADDTHQSRFGTLCGTCHSPTGWIPATFDHNLAAFKLTGKHTSLACESCHLNGVFRGTPSNCFACHSSNDAHQGRFGTSCDSCHTTWGWLPATFDHALSNFPLTGAHANVGCTSCHINNVFRGTPTACASCHADPPFHTGLFGTLCSQCHTTTAWIPASFNGNHTFPIHHGNASTCRDCHTTSLSAWTCYTCHNQAEIQDKHKEMGDFSNCISCHPTGREKGGGN